MENNNNPHIRLDPATVVWREEFRQFMEYRLDELKALFTQHEVEAEKKRDIVQATLTDHERRLAKLEKLWWLLTIIWGLMTAVIIPVITAIILQWMKL